MRGSVEPPTQVTKLRTDFQQKCRNTRAELALGFDRPVITVPRGTLPSIGEGGLRGTWQPLAQCRLQIPARDRLAQYVVRTDFGQAIVILARDLGSHDHDRRSVW